MQQLHNYIWITLLLMSQIVHAQDPMMGPKSADFDFKPDSDRLERMESLRIWKMTEFLELTSEQSMKFFPKMKEFEDVIRQEQHRQQELIQEIYQLTQDETHKASEKEVKKYARELAALECSIIDKKEQFINELRDVLTPHQQLRFLIFDHRFRHRLIKMMKHDRHDNPMMERRPK